MMYPKFQGSQNTLLVKAKSVRYRHHRIAEAISERDARSDHRRNMRFYEKLLQPIPFGFFVLGLIILNPLHIPPDSEARAEVPVVIKPVLIERTPEAAKELAQKLLPSWGWKTEAQWQCLESLWTKESNWRPDAYNRKAVYQNGEKLNAGGIPQILGLDPKISVEEQLFRGFTYIESRYSDPCSAWRFWTKNSWY